MMVTLKKALTEALRALQDQPLDTLLETREDKILIVWEIQGDPGGLIRERAPMAAIGRHAMRSTPGAGDQRCCTRFATR